MKLMAVAAAALVVALCCQSAVAKSSEPPDADYYSIPADAIRIGARELAAEQLTDHLAALLMGNGTSSVNSSSGAGVRHGSNKKEETNSGGVDDPLPTALARLGALLSAAEERKNRLESAAATSRLLSINRGAYFRGLLIVWLPVSFLLPTLAHHHRHRPAYDDGPDIEGTYFSKRRLSGATSNDVPSYDPDSSLYKFEPHYGPLLSRLEAYFDLMRVESVYCRWKLVCYASNRPEAFEPLSNLLKRLFERAKKRSPEPMTYHPALKRFHSYVWADKKGARYSSADQCDAEYRQCPLAASALIRTDVLDFWQKLSKRFAIQLQDE